MSTRTCLLFFAVALSSTAWASGTPENSSHVSSQSETAMGVDGGASFALLELFTSEGCSSCPPADAGVSAAVSAAAKSGLPVYQLAWHIDYWDYLGWKDPYDSKAATARQEQYAGAMQTQLFTPELVVNGGLIAHNAADAGEINRLIAVQLERKSTVHVALQVNAGADPNTAELAASITGAPKDSVIGLAVVENGLTQTPNAGENQGRSLFHDAVVRFYREVPLGAGTPEADGKATLVRATVPTTGVSISRAEIVAFVQQPGSLRILGATSADLSGVQVKASVSGQLLDARGVPVANSDIQVCSDTICLLGRSDSSGRFEVRGVPPGHYELKFPRAGSGGGLTSIPITVGPGQRLVLAGAAFTAGSR